MKRLLNKTTMVPAENSAAAITGTLARLGASRVMTHYSGGRISGLSWIMPISGNPVRFAMPVRTAGVQRILSSRRRGRLTLRQEELFAARARRVAWRQLYHWVEAQAAMIDAGMAEAAECFFAYATAPDGGPGLYAAIAETGLHLPPASGRTQ